MSAIIATSKLLAVQQICAVVLCKDCEISLPSERSAKDHLGDKHSVDLVSAKRLTEKAFNAAEAVLAMPNPLRDAYMQAPIRVSGSVFANAPFYRPLEGLAITKGYHCTLCTACYSSEKGMRTHMAEKHCTVPVDNEWRKVEHSGTINLQTIFNGRKTKFFPVSMANTLGDILSLPNSSTKNTPSQHSLLLSHASPSSPNVSDHSPPFNNHVQETFNDLEQALFSYDLSNNSIPRSHLNPYLAATNFDVQLQQENIDMKTAAQFTGLLQDYSEQENLALLDVKAYLNNASSLVSDISSAVLQKINLTGEKEFQVVSTKSIERYARNIARIVICAMRVRYLKFVSPRIASQLDNYFASLSISASDQHSREKLLHALLASICFSTFDIMDSPRNLFVRYFVMFATIIPNSRNNTDSFRCATSKDISPILAALLYGTSCCAVYEIHNLRLESQALSDNPSSSQVENKIRRNRLSSRMDKLLSALQVSNNNAASFLRKTLDIANAISRHEDVDFMFDTCQRHSLCGIVDNIHISMARLGEIVKLLHKEIDNTFSSLLYGASFPPDFFSYIADIPDNIQDKAPGSSFLTQGNMKLRSRKYAVWLFNQITESRPSGKTLFSPSSTSSTSDVVKVFGKNINRAAVQKWLAKLQTVQDKLLACTHLSSGSPGRATELETLHFVNSEFALRNLYISQGRITIITRYSKSRSLTGWDRVIPRFPDPATSKFFLTYLVLFRTLETVFVQTLHGSNAMKSHLRALFVERGTSYSASRIRDVIRATFHTHKLPIEFNHFRHFTVGMIPLITQNSSQIIHEEIIAEAREVAHLQAGHSSLVAEHNYARKPSDVPAITSTALDKYRLFSSEWHRNLGILPQPFHRSNHNQIPSRSLSPSLSLPVPPNALQSVSDSLAATLSQNMSQLIKNEIQTLSSNLLPSKRPSHPTTPFFTSKKPRNEVIRSPPQRDTEKDLSSYLPSLRKFLKTNDALFRSETQLTVTQAICDAQHDVLAVMPTGSGKTISVLLPVYLEAHHCSTVIIVPLAILVEEYINRCRNFGISVATWADRHQQVQVYVISADHTRKDIEDFLRGLQNQGRLRRLVIDEAHLIATWQLFRNSFQRLPYALKCRGHYIQFVLLTATLPPIHMERLLEILSIPSIVLYAQPTIRYNLKFSVINSSLTDPFHSNQGRIRSHLDIMTEVLCTQLLRTCSNLMNSNGGRILVFTLYRHETDRLSKVCQNHLGNHFSHPIPVRSYHAGMTQSVLRETYSFWKSNDDKVKVIVSTSAFGTGLDVPDVRAVFHFGASNGLLDYVQETGRAGRDGLPADCIIIYNQQYAEQHTTKLTSSAQQHSYSSTQHNILSNQEWEFMTHYMSQQLLCRKNMLYSHVDGQAPGMCIFNPNSLNCDVCNSFQHSKSPQQAPQVSQPLSTTAHIPSNALSLPNSLHASPILQPTSQPFNSENSIIPSYQFGAQPQCSQPPQSLAASPNPQPNPQPSPSIHRQPQIPFPIPHPPSLNIPQPPSTRKILSFSSSDGTDTTLSDFRSTAHSLQNICIPCLIIDSTNQLSEHRCRHMKNRCKRCFALGHQVAQCSTFDPKQRNFCFRCSLSQIKGQNAHKAGEFGGKCFLGVTRDLAWMLWAKNLESQNIICDALFHEFEQNKFQECGNDIRLRQDFYVTWLQTQWDGIPNLVRLALWWFNTYSQ